MDTKLQVVLCCTLMVLLQSVNVFSATSPCGATQCDDVGGECNRDVCYCKPRFYDATCSTACGACDAPATEACDAADSCIACGTACTNGGTCAAVGAAGGTVECKCPDTHTGATCQHVCSGLTCTVYEKCQPKGDDSEAECDCKGGLSGADCKAVIDCADGQPCMNGGSCATSQCNCAAGFVGKICQHACTCTSLQTCVAKADDTGSECSCKSGLEGPTCTTVKCSPTSPCEQGGTCNTDRCDCAENTVGTICQHTCSPVCAAGKVCTEKADKTGADCQDGASSVVVTWAVLVLGVWSAFKLY